MCTRWRAEEYKADWTDIIRLIDGSFLDFIKSLNLPSDATICELGAGSCKWSATMALMGYKVTTIDNNPDMLVQGQRNFPNIKMEYVVDELPNLSSEASKRKYDLVINEGVNEHFLDRNERINVIKAMKSCCIDGGYVYFIVPFLSVEPDEHRYTSIREMELEVREAGLEPVLVDIGVFQTATQIHTMLRVLAKRR